MKDTEAQQSVSVFVRVFIILSLPVESEQRELVFHVRVVFNLSSNGETSEGGIS